MKIKISNLKEGIHEFEFTGSVNEIQLEEPFTGNYQMKVEIDKSNHQLLVHAIGHAEANVVCDRCSKEFMMPVGFDFRVVYMYQQNHLVDPESDNIVYITPDTDTVDIRSDIYDYSHLALPMKVLCNDSCKGICYRCGVDLNNGECSCSPSDKEEGNNSPFKDLKNLINN
ncbi:MAG: DUF177 domain-containing protein [Ignavibacteria bacterium]|nr:DUF177 domain-containing protein [Ignavibacteria bacterium]